MTNQNHILKRQIIELTVPNQKIAPAIQDEISRVYRQRIVPLIDQYCSELSTPDRLYRIDRLELDLGTLDVENLEEQFIASIKTALRQELSAQIEQQEQTPQPGQNPKTLSALELFTLFVRTGTLPWWADHQNPTLLTENLQQLLDEKPAAFLNLLRTLIQETGVRQRLIRQYDDQQLGQLAGLLTPPYRETFTPETLKLVAALRKTQPGRELSPARLRESVWSHSLQVAGLGGADYPDRAAFSQAVLERVANELGRDVLEDVLPILHKTKKQKTSASASKQVELMELTKLVEDLRRVSPTPTPAAWAALATDLPHLSETQREQLRQAVMDTASTPQHAAARIAQMLQLNEYSVLTRLLTTTTAAEQPESELAALLRRLESRGGTLTEVWTALRVLVAARRLSAPAQVRWLTLLRAEGSPPNAESLIRFLSGDTSQDGLSPRERVRLLGLLRGEPTATASPSPDLSFSAADEATVTNAGLVILWPFLSSFFGHLGLLEERDFKDLAARQRAVGLLQVLATGQADFPEYLLPLNKLLCGLELTHPFDFGPPLRKPEAKDVKSLLKAVIAQAPILNNMSIDGFRASFLLRSGLLTTHGGHWLLRVERQTYDIVLERFPWSWEWVRLPWMEAPLRVEWNR